jgi:hypothetical protein
MTAMVFAAAIVAIKQTEAQAYEAGTCAQNQMVGCDYELGPMFPVCLAPTECIYGSSPRECVCDGDSCELAEGCSA